MMDQATDFAGVLQHRARLLAEKATFRQDGDTVPIAHSVATLYQIDENGVVRQSEADLLGENYWGISKILSR